MGKARFGVTKQVANTIGFPAKFLGQIMISMPEGTKVCGVEDDEHTWCIILEHPHFKDGSYIQANFCRAAYTLDQGKETERVETFDQFIGLDLSEALKS